MLSRPFGKVTLLLYVSRSSVVSSCRASNLLVRSSWNSTAFSGSTTSFGLFCRLASLARSSFVLMVNVPRTMRWSSPVLNLLITDTSVKTWGLSVRMWSISFFYGPFWGDPCPTPAGWRLEKCVHDFQLIPFAKLMRESPLLLPVPSPNPPVQDLDGSPEPALALKSPIMMLKWALLLVMRLSMSL